MNEVEKIVDTRLWRVCAGATIHVPLPDSNVCYFPQGHAEQTRVHVAFDSKYRVSPYILCKVVDVKLMADLELDEVYAKIMLIPLGNSLNIHNIDDERDMVDNFQFPYFARKIKPKDLYPNGGFYVPRDRAESIFPQMDRSADRPAQTVKAKDIRGKVWEFKHTYTKKTRRNMLTSGWSSFSRKVKAGDSVVFVQAENGDVCVGIRRAMKAWGRGTVRPEDVIEAVSNATNGQQFEVTYYPHASSGQFVVNASSVKTALCNQWCGGMRFKMDFENDDLSGISWFSGTVSSVQAVDPFRWPNSPWLMLQVKWDEEQAVLQNVKYVSPWQVQVQVDLVSNNPSIQRAMHSVFQIPIPIPSLDRNPTDKLELNLFPKHYESHQPSGNNDLTIAGCSSNVKKNDYKSVFRLFGQSIPTDPQVNNSSVENANEYDDDVSDHCEVFLGSEDVCRGTLYLSAIESYNEVEKTLASMFENEKFDDSTRVMYKDSAGVEKQMGHEAFSEFVTKAKRLTILKARNS